MTTSEIKQVLDMMQETIERLNNTLPTDDEISNGKDPAHLVCHEIRVTYREMTEVGSGFVDNIFKVGYDPTYNSIMRKDVYDG